MDGRLQEETHDGRLDAGHVALEFGFQIARVKGLHGNNSEP